MNDTTHAAGVPEEAAVERYLATSANAAGREWVWFLLAYAVLIAGAFAAWLLYQALEPDPFSPAPEISVFALLYVFAQTIERLLEPVSAFYDAKVDRVAATPQTDSRRRKVVALWAAASILGMLGSAWLGVFLLRLVGVVDAPYFVDIAVTGVVVGAGTKPLHDLISHIQKAKEAKERA